MWWAGAPQNSRSPGAACVHGIMVEPDWYPAAVRRGHPRPSCWAAQYTRPEQSRPGGMAEPPHTYGTCIWTARIAAPTSPADEDSSAFFLKNDPTPARRDSTPPAPSSPMTPGAMPFMSPRTGSVMSCAMEPSGSRKNSLTPRAASANHPAMPPPAKWAMPPPENPVGALPGLPPGRRFEAA